MAYTHAVSKDLNRRARRRDGPFGLRYYAIVYAVEAPEVSRIKFGRTLDMNQRMASLCGSSPVELKLIGSCWMPDDAEAHIHQYLADDHSHYEWFLRTERTRAIAALIASDRVVELAHEIGMSSVVTEHMPSGVSWGRTSFK